MSIVPSNFDVQSEGVDEEFSEKEFLRPLFRHYRDVRVQMQLVSIGISILVSATEIATAGKFTPAAFAVLSGVPLCAGLAWLMQQQKRITQSFLCIFDRCVVVAALVFDACACAALTQSDSQMFSTCVAYLTVAYVLPQVCRRSYARMFTVAHLPMVLYLFKFNVEKFVPFVINCLLLDVGNDRLARSLGFVAQRQMFAVAELFEKSQSFIKSMLFGFCDALVVMGPDWTLAEESQSLSTLLGGRPAPKGKSFESFIDEGDREEFQRLMQSPITISPEMEAKAASKDGVKSVRMQTVRVHLHDAYNNAVVVHVCSASLQTMDGKPLHLVGISEMSPLISKRPRAKQPQQRQRRPALYNIASRQYETRREAWTAKEVQVHFSASSLQVHAKTSNSCLGSSSRKRRDSPLPEGAQRRSRSAVSPSTSGTSAWRLSEPL